ncbi:MAG: hypothetical protein BEN19_02760 [Epulopiscium sp. Nuni2H_MBin003]|nr:MAG: hypothetical protein BEN19_02760 [Epulopiscium sp. Nuni2H_MBin003]
MIKLIVTDIDGTFLGLKIQMPERAFEVIEKLIKNNVLFVAASGRSYPAIAELFTPFLEDIAIIAENGGIIEYKQQEISLNILPEDVLADMIEFLDKNNTHPIVNSKQTSYIFPRIHAHYGRIEHYCANMKTITGLCQITQDVVSISIFVDDQKVDEVYAKLTKRWGDSVSIVITGTNWIDVVPRGINKGEALAKLMNELNIKSSEVMAFGDYDNDIEMLKLASESYAMPHATEGVKKVAKYTCTPEDIVSIMENIVDKNSHIER